MTTTGESSAVASEVTTEAAAAPVTNRKQPFARGFLDTISEGWAEREEVLPQPTEQAPFAAVRRDAVSAAFADKRVVVRAGALKQRSNDTDYPFRALTSFTHLTGWGAETEPDSILVFEPTADGHEVTLYFRERADRTTSEFYSDASIGEFWIGPRPSLAGIAALLGIATDHLANFTASDADVVDGEDDKLTEFLGELRLVKDAYEQEQMREAVRATAAGFDDILRALPAATAHQRGERVVEGAFHARARLEGNWEGYDTIAASGPHATYLHWTRNDGEVRAGDLLLVDAGVEVDSLFTADITRTIPVNGTFSETQRKIYEAVREAADAAFAIVRPGIRFRDVHETAMGVIATRVAEWGLLPVTAQEALDADLGGQHRRYMVHGTSHHLGIDVHDCAGARREMYYDGIIEAGMVFTIEPGLYFQADDLTVPAEFRGIGVRIEDDILVTEDGAENLSADIPRTADDVEAWVQRLIG